LPKKRENRGRRKGDKGHVGYITCDNCGARIPEDKAICVTRPYSLVDATLAAELEKKGAIIPRYSVTKCYCINCAVHFGIVKIRAESERKSRATSF
jgi:small subunit ribosomal protein S26e